MSWAKTSTTASVIFYIYYILLHKNDYNKQSEIIFKAFAPLRDYKTDS